MSDKGANRIAIAIFLLALSIASTGWYVSNQSHNETEQFLKYCLKHNFAGSESGCLMLWYFEIGK